MLPELIGEEATVGKTHDLWPVQDTPRPEQHARNQISVIYFRAAFSVDSSFFRTAAISRDFLFKEYFCQH